MTQEQTSPGGGEPVIQWTMFRTPSAMSLEVHQHTLAQLAQYLADAGPFKSKASCPWIKLAQFGNKRSGKNSLRINANVVSISGVEGDYDGEQIMPERAVELLEQHQIRAIVYTSPSHRPERPRWRVLAPLSAAHTPDTRRALLARVNGALGGILSPESFTLSQSYYFGEVEGVEYKVFVTFNDPEEGCCVDELDELDDIAISREASRHPADEDVNSGPGDYSVRMFEDAVAQKGRKLKTGDGRRELLKQYIASRSAKGLLRDELLTMVEGVINRYFDPMDLPDQQNLLDVIDYFVAKDAGVATQPIDLSGFMPEDIQGMPTGREVAVAAPVAPAVIERRSKDEPLAQYPPPYPGLMAEICMAAEAAAFKPQPKLNLLGAIVGMASCINGEYSTQSGGRFNLFGLGSLESGGGKDLPRSMAEAVAASAKAGILGKPASGAGLEDAIADRRAMLVAIDEIAHMMAAINDDRAPAHLKDIAATLLKLYSASRSTYNRRVLANGSTVHKQPTMVANPCLSMLGFATPDGLGEAFDERNLKDGLMGRLLYVPGDQGVLPRRPKSGVVVPQAVLDWSQHLQPINALASVAGAAAKGSVIVQEAHGIADVMDRLMVDLERRRTHSGDTLGPALFARSFEKVERIAGVLAISEDPRTPVVRLQHVEWARAMVLASDDHLLAFARQCMHSGDVTRDAVKLRETILAIRAGRYHPQRPAEKEALEHNCIMRSHLLRASRMQKSDFDRTLAHMQDLSELTAFDEKGKASRLITDIEVE